MHRDYLPHQESEPVMEIPCQGCFEPNSVDGENVGRLKAACFLAHPTKKHHRKKDLSNELPFLEASSVQLTQFCSESQPCTGRGIADLRGDAPNLRAVQAHTI